jgi:hypothetical protein
MRLSPRATALTATAVLALSLTACATDDAGTATGTSGSAAQAEEAVALDTGVLTAENFAERVSRAADDAASVTTSMSTTVLGTPMTSEFTISATGGTRQVVMLLTMGTETLEARMVDGTLYVNEGASTGGKFVVVDPEDSTSPYASLLDSMDEQADPSAMVDTLDDAILSVELLDGTEEIDGVTVQHYRVSVDLGTVTDDADDDASASPTTVVYDYWIDADDLWHRVTVDAEDLAMEMTASGWGEPVEITAPSADEIA